MSMPITQTPLISNQPAQTPARTAAPAPAKAAAAPPKSLGDTLVLGGAGLMVGAHAGALTGGLGVGTYTALTMGSNVPMFHKVLGVIGAGGMSAIGGAAAGAVGGAAAASLAQSKSGGAAVGAVAGGILGAVAVGALNVAMKKFEPGAIVAGAAAGAAFGAAGGLATKVMID